MNNLIISTKNITKFFGTRKILDNINIEIAEQSLVSIIGPNGAGKSTLVKIILGLDKNYTGTVNIREGEKVQYIPQLSISDQHQLPMSVYEYMAIATSRIYSLNIKEPNFEKALEHVNVPVEKLYQQYTTLSGGERQRVAIARALLSEPTILVLDEPLAAVDHTSRLGLYELIRHLQQDHKMTVLLISHDIDSVLPLSDQVICLNTTFDPNCSLSKELTKSKQKNKPVNNNC